MHGPPPPRFVDFLRLVQVCASLASVVAAQRVLCHEGCASARPPLFPNAPPCPALTSSGYDRSIPIHPNQEFGSRFDFRSMSLAYLDAAHSMMAQQGSSGQWQWTCWERVPDGSAGWEPAAHTKPCSTAAWLQSGRNL